MSYTLRCVGCGEIVLTGLGDAPDVARGACTCGAVAPLLINTEASEVYLPRMMMALVTIFREKKKPLLSAPHLEVFMGYSDHVSGGRVWWSHELKRLGCTSQSDCPDADCKASFYFVKRAQRERRR